MKKEITKTKPNKLLSPKIVTTSTPRPHIIQSKNISGSEQLWCRAPPLAPKDSVFAQQTSKLRKKECSHIPNKQSDFPIPPNFSQEALTKFSQEILTNNLLG